MKKCYWHFIMIFVPLCLAFGIRSTAADFIPLPRPKQMKLNNRGVVFGSKIKLTTPVAFSGHYKFVVDSFGKSLTTSPAGGNVPITVEVLSGGVERSLPNDVAAALKHREGYWIKITDKGVKILGADELGALHGLTTLEGLVAGGKGKIAQGQILDWPDLKIRAFHLVLKRIKPEVVKQVIKSLRFGHFNTLILQLANGVRLSSMKAIADDDAWTEKEFLDVVRFARENGLDVIPEIRLLTHQERLLKDKYPNLMFNRSTYDPAKEETYAVVLPMIDEVINLIHPRAFHIGHDEVAGHSVNSGRTWLRRGERILPPALFLKDVERLHAHLQKRGVETWMWGDMLIAPKEFSGLRSLHGTQGYAGIRDRIPKDVVICDWHFFESDRHSKFTSALAFAGSGHRVLGVTWKRVGIIKNFSKYIANMPTNGEGMIATTWALIRQRKWDTVNEIIETSAESFWNAK